MDPEQTLKEIGEAVEKDDWETAGDRAADLAEWIDKGGYVPKVTGQSKFDFILVRAAVESIMNWELPAK